ncbi:hypothetical protein GE09DRAFT_166567 [Coniochaeta sp. 2T2.1]|nr:hypothetical protein GE09DRAFT_166567 [Coniochaeta sp. 2T2.1]
MARQSGFPFLRTTVAHSRGQKAGLPAIVEDQSGPRSGNGTSAQTPVQADTPGSGSVYGSGSGSDSAPPAGTGLNRLIATAATHARQRKGSVTVGDRAHNTVLAILTAFRFQHGLHNSLDISKSIEMNPWDGRGNKEAGAGNGQQAPDYNIGFYPVRDQQAPEPTDSFTAGSNQVQVAMQDALEAQRSVLRRRRCILVHGRPLQQSPAATAVAPALDGFGRPLIASSAFHGLPPDAFPQSVFHPTHNYRR